MKKLILTTVLAIAVSAWATAQTSSQQTSSKESGPKAEEKPAQKNVKNGVIKKANKKAAASVDAQDFKLPVPDYSTNATNSSDMAPKPTEEK